MSDIAPAQEENLALVERAFESYDSGNLDRVLGFAHPDVEVYVPSELPNSGTFSGHDGYISWIQTWLEAWEQFEIELEAMEPVGERHVVSQVKQTAVGRGSGVPVEMTAVYMSEVRDGKLAAIHLYPAWEQAVEIATEREAEAEPPAN